MKKVNELVTWLIENGFRPNDVGYTYRDKLVQYQVRIDARYVRIGASIQFNNHEYIGRYIYAREQLEALAVDTEGAVLLAMKSAFLDAMGDLGKDYIEHSILSDKEGGGII